MTERQRRLQELRNYEKYIKEQLKESRRQYLENPFKPYQPPPLLHPPLHSYPQHPQHQQRLPPIRRYTRRTLRPLQAYPLPQQQLQYPLPLQAYPLPQQQQQYQRYTQIPIQRIQPESVDKFCKRHHYVKRIAVSNIPKVHKDLKKTVTKFKRDSNMPIISPSNIPKVYKGLKEFDIKLKRSSRLSTIPES